MFWDDLKYFLTKNDFENIDKIINDNYNISLLAQKEFCNLLEEYAIKNILKKNEY